MPDAPSRPVRLLHLSDLHACVFVSPSTIDQAIERAEALRPDLICVTGDFITRPTGFDRARYQEQLRRITRIAPSFATLGNHDGGYWAGRRGGFPGSGEIGELVTRAGFELLHNRNTALRVNGRPLTLAGVGDLWSREIRPAKAFAGLDPAQPAILLSHNPDSKELLRPYPWKLMLSGHTHGGQLRIPLAGTPFAPVIDRRYVDGLRPWQDRYIHVTRGVGNTLGLRWNCPPEINLIEL
jgi:predicted MPP superfamily phosphohydrolase